MPRTVRIRGRLIDEVYGARCVQAEGGSQAREDPPDPHSNVSKLEEGVTAATLAEAAGSRGGSPVGVDNALILAGILDHQPIDTPQPIASSRQHGRVEVSCRSSLGRMLLRAASQFVQHLEDPAVSCRCRGSDSPRADLRPPASTLGSVQLLRTLDPVSTSPEASGILAKQFIDKSAGVRDQVQDGLISTPRRKTQINVMVHVPRHAGLWSKALPPTDGLRWPLAMSG